MNPLQHRIVLKRIMLVVVIGSVVVLVVIGLINVYIKGFAAQRMYDEPEKVPEAYTALILGAKVLPNGWLSHMLEDRVLTGLALYRQGKVKKFLLSGDHGQVEYDEVNAMRQYLLDRDVPPQDIFMDHAGFRTYDSMYRARDVFLVQDVIVVTQKFHLARAVYIARSLELQAVGMIADRRTYTRASQTKADLREIFARVKAFFDVHVWHARPKFLGKVIPITGDGRTTVD